MAQMRRRETRTAVALPRSLVVLFALGVSVRLALMLLYQPAALQNPDTIAYLTLPPYQDPRQPSGVNLLVAPFGAIGSLQLLVLAQHLLGVVGAGLLTAAARRLGCGWSAASAVGAAALLAGDVLYVEHAVLTEPLFTALAAGALLATLRAAATGRLPSAVAAGGLAGAALCTRSVGVVVVVAVVGGLLLASVQPRRRRVTRSVCAMVMAAAVLGVYLIGFAITEDGKAGIGDWSGWYAYARAAPFADCRAFAPPAGTEMLCESSDADSRPGPSFYLFDPASPARVAFGRPPFGGDVLSRFGRAAMRAQPRAYAHAVTRDVLRYFDDDFGRERAADGGGYDTVALDRRDAGSEAIVAAQAGAGPFGPLSTPVVHAPDLVELYAAVFGLDGRVLLVLTLLAGAGAGLVRGTARRGAALYGATAAALLVVPAMTVSFEARYAIPAALLLTVPAAVGAEAIARRFARQTPPAGDSPVTPGAAPGGRSASGA